MRMFLCCALALIVASGNSLLFAQDTKSKQADNPQTAQEPPAAGKESSDRFKL